MPPRAIPSAVPSTIRNAIGDGSPLRCRALSPCRSRNSSTMDGGNLGAPPNPPADSS